ncbi:hypothetical protein N9K75_00910 [bacterium]|nr:hypothetical protein [bacterium]
MENNSVSYIKADNNIIINEKCIAWVKKMGDCLEVCAKTTGCNVIKYDDTYRICKINNPASYHALNKLFE